MMLNKIHNAECFEFMKSMDSASIDLTVTSPPYDNLRTYNGYVFDFENIAKQLYRVTKPGGVVVWVVGDATIKGSETGTSFRHALYFKDIGFNLHDTMIYQKVGCAHPDFTRYYQQFEYMFILSVGSPKSFNQICDRVNKLSGSSPCGSERKKNGSVIKSWANKNKKTIKKYGARYNIWQYANVTGRDKHPAIFPEKLAHDHIISWSNPGDTVFDPFTGSGTTLKMAKQLGRNFIGCEISKEYCAIAEKRVFGNA